MNNFKNIKAVIFDLDDTLMDRKAALRVYSTYFVNKHFPQFSEKKKKHMAEEMFDSDDSYGFMNKDEFFNILIKKWNWKDAPAIDELKAEWYSEFPKHAVPMGNMEQVVDHLRMRGFKLGMITNGSPSQNVKIDVLGLRKKMETVIVSKEVNMNKPQPEIFHLACGNLAVKPSEAVYVGDNLINDVQGSLAAGLRAVWLNSIEPYNKVEADENCYRIAKLLDVLELCR